MMKIWTSFESSLFLTHPVAACFSHCLVGNFY